MMLVQKTLSIFPVSGMPVRKHNVSIMGWLKLGKIRALWLCLITAFFCQNGLKAIASLSLPSLKVNTSWVQMDETQLEKNLILFIIKFALV